MTDNFGSTAQGQLKSFVQRLSRLQDDKDAVQEDMKEVVLEAKGMGFNGPTLRKVVRLTRMNKAKRQEAEALLELYLSAVEGAPAEDDYPEDEDRPQADAPGLFDRSAETADELFARAVQLVRGEGKASASLIQRRLQLGYNLAASLMERMEREGIVSPADHAGARTVLPQGVDTPEPPPAPDTEPEAAAKGAQAQADGLPITANPYPPRSRQRAAWDEAWCGASGSDGMEIPGHLQPGRPPAPEPKGPDA